MSELIPLPLTAVQKLRMLSRLYEGVLIMQVCHFGLACKVKTGTFSIAFPIRWDVIETLEFAELERAIATMTLEQFNEKSNHG